MPLVDTKHPQYMDREALWFKVRTVIEGEEAVKGAGTKVLPMLGGQTPPEYDAYVERALFFGATARTVEGLAGMIMRKEPRVDIPSSVDLDLENIGRNNESFAQLAKDCVTEVTGVGRVGLFVDAAPAEEGGDEANPYITAYNAEDVINWDEEVINGRKQPVLVVIEEQVQLPLEELSAVDRATHDEFNPAIETRWRVLLLEQRANGERVYMVRIYRKDDTKTGKDAFVQVGEDVTPTRSGGRSLDYIPFTFVTPDGTTTSVAKPPVMDISYVNLSHYRTSADLEHGRHFTALPTAYIIGGDIKAGDYKIGSSVAWLIENENAKVGFLEFTGKGLGSLDEALDRKEKQMAVLGARLLEQQKSGVEAADTVRLRQSGEKSVLSGVANSCSEGLTQVLRWCTDWVAPGTKVDNVSVQLNDDFDVTGIDPTMLAQLMVAVQSGMISYDVFYHKLQQAETYPDDWDMDTEKQLIELGPPMGTPEEPAPGDDEPSEDDDEANDEEA